MFWKNVPPKNEKKEIVCIALSGGVDSSVAAYILHQEGYEVIAAFIKVWQPDFLPCSQDEDRLAAKRVAAALGIPFYVVDLAEEYKKGIVEYMVDSYTRGETPNPDVTCNKVIKFGALWQWAQAHGCEYIATGHHAQICAVCPTDNKTCSRRFELSRGADPAKDQAYFLWELTNDDLAHILLPIGHMQKADVRALAARASLPSASRKDSQGLCFLGSLRMSDFLAHLVPNKKGAVRNEAGDVVGEHDGAHLFTRGQRGGFTLSTKTDVPLYVVSVNTYANEVTVAPSVESYMTDTLLLRSCVLRAASESLTHAEVRYHGEQIAIKKLVPVYNRGAVTHAIRLAKKVLVSPGQSCVVYCGSVCVGGGIVTEE